MEIATMKYAGRRTLKKRFVLGKEISEKKRNKNTSVTTLSRKKKKKPRKVSLSQTKKKSEC